MLIEQIVADRASRGVGPYSQAVKANGFLFVSGQLGLEPNTGTIVSGGIDAETRQALRNVTEILVAAGSSWESVVKVTLFLADMEDFATVNRIYEAVLGRVPPARSAVAVSSLPRNALLEIEVIAVA